MRETAEKIGLIEEAIACLQSLTIANEAPLKEEALRRLKEFQETPESTLQELRVHNVLLRLQNRLEGSGGDALAIRKIIRQIYLHEDA